MTKEEYIEKLNTFIALNSLVSRFNEKACGKIEGLNLAVELAKELDKPKTVTIPQFVAELIFDSEFDNIFDMVKLVYQDSIFEYGSKMYKAHERTQAWLKKGHLHDFISAFENGYEIEEPTYRVPLPNLNSDNGKQFITYKNGKWFACAHRNNLQQEFTEVELANLPKPYCDYERVEVKDND
ncbi:DUF1642 domain-containing protein [Pediococcus pentosaceus]|uniref:DUF1642 domain-containing protein n=1 Tax=Pediococcus pentosaceus TaxID=1255 RepID=UPI0021A6904A|nr:DUF1642 domain-containing protein [Pediococcus pentosaceus]MCT3021244.1 DUF1642 domain-containing protein [Pediococcus pentosaceus]